MTKSTWQLASLDRLALLVRLGDSLHAIPIGPVEEVLPNLPIAPIPQCPPFVKGVVFVRGHLIPILDARERLGLPEGARSLDPHLVCVRVGDRIVGLEVDEAVDLIEIDPEEIVGAGAVGARAGLFMGLIERNGQVIRLLNPEKVVAAEEVESLERVGDTMAVKSSHALVHGQTGSANEEHV